VQTEFPPDYVRSRIDAFYNEYLAWIEARHGCAVFQGIQDVSLVAMAVQDGLEEEEFQTCLHGVSWLGKRFWVAP
jgi:hypothetical protein